MDAYFNELSADLSEADVPAISRQTERYLSDTCKCLKKHGVRTCWISHSDFGKLMQQIIEQDSRNARGLYYSFFRSPYEDGLPELKRDEYLNHNWAVNGRNCEGAAYAFLMGSLTVSLYILPWTEESLELFRDDESIWILNVSSSEHEQALTDWIESKSKAEIVKTDLSPSAKELSLRDDHGKNILEKMGRKLNRSPYVIGIVNSLQFHPNRREFIYKVHGNGIIDVVLPWTDEGLGMAVQTTGRNYIETEIIAGILETEYGRA